MSALCRADRARAYTDLALEVIRSYRGSAAALGDWWRAEAQHREDNGLDQSHVDELRAELVQRHAELNAQQEAA